MITIKTPQEIAIMTKAGKILADVVYEVVKKAKPGVSELELDTLAEKLIIQRGGEPGFKKVPGYVHTICSATNNVVVHGIPGAYRLQEGDIIGVDCGVYMQGFHTDMAETVYVGNPAHQPEAIKKFLTIGRQAMLDSIAMVQPGNRIGHISQAIQKKVEKEGRYGVTRSLIGHGVGRELHEDPEIPGYVVGSIQKSPLIKPGMTLAVEVIYNMGSPEVMYKGTDEWTIVSADGTLSGVFERTVLVTQTGHTVLTES